MDSRSKSVSSSLARIWRGGWVGGKRRGVWGGVGCGAVCRWSVAMYLYLYCERLVHLGHHRLHWG